ncbi:glucosidase [Parasediminibacterium paludis]|uniref:Glucosidase n=1 Tax=Parasediminibacterium paludis TaxID=908966 RepID=A0ABV8Q065_9BACT
MNKEQERLLTPDCKKWGSYISDRQWGTVREDYSANGDAWHYTNHDIARSKAYRWGEEGIAGICDDQQLLCFAIALWNKKDPIIKERYFGLTGTEGNHGEDVKELYYYLDATPSHSYMKMLYKYPQAAFPYEQLINENKRRNKSQPEFELIDTGVFKDDKYYDVFVEYAKVDATDILIKITVHNRSNADADLQVLPTIWFRNTWTWGDDNAKPQMMSTNNGNISISHQHLGDYTLFVEGNPPILFCNNETNYKKVFNTANTGTFFKDGINDYIVHGNHEAININANGTKAAANYDINIKANASTTIKLRLSTNHAITPFQDFDTIFAERLNEANVFYADIQKHITSEDEKLVQRQAFAGMIWSKQFYYYNVNKWLQGDSNEPKPPSERLKGRNASWQHLNNADIISMPDKWEYPWYASWDLAFHCIPFAIIDATFAKKQLKLLTREWYMHPNGQLPAYEWNFSDVNPPVHAWSAFRVFKIDEAQKGKPDVAFLESVFHKLLLNFTWWVNRKDKEGNNIFEGGFLGLDNIGVFDRSAPLPTGGYIEQADGTSWMAMYSLNMLRISLELARYNPVYQDMATKFFEHFLYIAQAMDNMGTNAHGLWDDIDGFFYDVLQLPNGKSAPLKVRSMVGLIPLFAVEVLDHDLLAAMPDFTKRLQWLYNNKPELASLVSRWNVQNNDEKHLLSLLRGHRMKKILEKMLDESEFLSDYGIRAVSKYHDKHPYEFFVEGKRFAVNYVPGESDSDLFGGNSNWRGPVWMPVNFLIIESLQRFHFYYGDDFKVECPKGSGNLLSLNEVADELSKRLSKLFLKDEHGNRPVYGNYEQLQKDPNFNNYILFYEYFHGDSGRGVGASHQTGWTGLVARLLQPRENPTKK